MKFQCPFWRPGWLLLLGLLLWPLFQPTVAHAQPLNEFFEIHSPDVSFYDNYLMKFTYLGPQKKSVLSLGVHGPMRPFDQFVFEPWQVDYNYANDSVMGHTMMLPGPEWSFFMDTIMGDPQLQDTVRIPDPNLSIMIFTDHMGAPMCWEHLAHRGETDLIFQLLADSVVDPAQKETIHRFRRQMAGVRQ